MCTGPTHRSLSASLLAHLAHAQHTYSGFFVFSRDTRWTEKNESKEMTESERLAHVEVPTMFGWLMFKYNTEGVQLSKICVYDMPPGATPYIMVLMPLGNDREDSIYELDMVNQDMHNQDIIAEHARATTGTDHACMMIMTGWCISTLLGLQSGPRSHPSAPNPPISHQLDWFYSANFSETILYKKCLVL